MLGKAKKKTLTTNPNDTTNNHKQPNQGSKTVRFSSRDQDTKSTTTPAQKAKSLKLILKSNTKIMTDDQQSVTTISEHTDSQDDTETDQTYDHSSGQGAMMDILCPDLDSDSDSDDSLSGTECLDNLSSSDHIVSNMQAMKIKLATSIMKLLNTEPVSALFDTGTMYSYILASLYDQISKKVAITKKHLKVGQADGRSLGPKCLVRLLIKINSNHFGHLFIVCQNLKQPLNTLC